MGEANNPDVKGKETTNRREFFAKSAKIIIPALGVLGLTLTGFDRKPTPRGCETCVGTCYGGCNGTCYGTCGGTCSGTSGG